MPVIQFQVRKNELASTRIVALPAAELAQGQVRVQIDLLAYTANNITYAAFGEAMHYWQFFPVPGEADGSVWGCIPAWGFGQVIESQHLGVAVGERLWGFWPMAAQVVLQPVRVGQAGFLDGADHRAALHGVYNQYLFCRRDPFHTAGSEALQALLRPLFLTAWLIDDFLADAGFFGIAESASGSGSGDGGSMRAVLLLSSASSKTAIATAALLAQRREIHVVGLSSAANLDFCRSLGIYSHVLAYDQLDALAADTPCIYVDFAGNGALRKAVHTRFARLAYSCAVGGTHVEQLASGRDLPGPRPTLFFAPAQAKKRIAEWGMAKFNDQLVQAWCNFIGRVADPAAPWLQVQQHAGPAAVQALHAQLLGGRADARVGHVMTLQPAPQEAG